MSIHISIEHGQVHTVNIQGDIAGPHINLELSPTVAYDLLLALEANREDLRDLATNYYDCPDCGQTHHKSTVCPNIAR